MILFQIKKSFFDGWDNLIALLAVNIGLGVLYVAEGFMAWAVISVSGSAPVSILEILILLAGYLVCSIATGGATWYMNAMADSNRPAARDFLEGIKKTAGRSVLFGLVAFMACLVFLVSFRFYIARADFFGVFLAGFLGWAFLFCIIALQNFYPVMVRLGGSFPRIIKKCFMLTVDNLWYSLFIFLWHGLGLAASIFTIGLLPGFGGLLLSGLEGVRLRAYKYDWLEANPGAKRSAVPWDELLKDDEELLGPRSLKSMIFPWKDDKR